MSDIAIILGSARSDGNTRNVVDYFNQQFTLPLDMFDLNDFPMEYFDYKMEYLNDNHLSLCKKLVKYKYWIFATPVYWYSMSAIMKNFLDRITDLLYMHKDLGNRLKQIQLGVLSCGSSKEIPDFFAEPFRLSANYLQMGYVGHAHSWTSRDGTIKKKAGKENQEIFQNNIVNSRIYSDKCRVKYTSSNTKKNISPL